MPTAAIPNGLAEFQKLLIGTWNNHPLPNAKNGEGSKSNPLSYNVMPLPQSPPNYILKNFTYYEKLQFEGNDSVSPPATAPNRGSDNLQVPTALFYEQTVEFAEGPGKGEVVHVENGSWLNLITGDKLVGPYPPPPGTGIKLQNPNQQPADITLAKQMSVPHGNSILALGSFSGPTSGEPSIPNSASILPTPTGLDTTTYTSTLNENDNYQNPQPDLTANPNLQLQKAVKIIKPTSYYTWNVSTDNQGCTMNIPFEKRVADVCKYHATYWLLSTGGDYNILAYTQTIIMKFMIGNQKYDFPHVTVNVVTKNS